MIRAIAWDIDGTLVDSEPLHLFALKEVCRVNDVDISDLDDMHFVGVHIGNVWKELQSRFPAKLSFAGWSTQLNRVFAENAGRLVEIEGAVSAIEAIAAMDLRQAAVSNSNRTVVDTNLSAIGVTDFMNFSLSLDDVCEGKPDPFPFRYACYRFGLNASEVLAVEDSATGVASALAAGLPVACIGGNTGVTKGPVFPISTLADLPHVIAELNGASDNVRKIREHPHARHQLREA
ncbi:MAG: HAD family phosphatase [Sulfitobacter sp.]|uniref:HAD family hydrolase n=1 Tax=Alphaproteobacteria TaxID=28211 RepID=UPI002943B2F0|nr:HAD family phosphatase [Sulfitobacter sp. LC.270.F.C4]WOI16665.1 HAD family phosphatase [Sulfitobacter sp. LC.270.F.C4]